MTRPRWLKKGARVVVPGTVVCFEGDDVLIRTRQGQSWFGVASIGKDFTRAPKRAKGGK